MTIKQRALLKHKLILQSAQCVEELLLTVKHNTGRVWVDIVMEHMQALFPERKKVRKPKVT